MTTEPQDTTPEVEVGPGVSATELPALGTEPSTAQESIATYLSRRWEAIRGGDEAEAERLLRVRKPPSFTRLCPSHPQRRASSFGKCFSD